MYEHKIYAIIPARGGSKGLIDKNIKPLNGKPLICYTIVESLKSKLLCRVFVSTDSPSIAKISKNCGAEIIDRPGEFARDESPTIDAIFHAIDTMKDASDKDIIILLQPTSPLRNTTDIDTALDIFMKTDCDSVISMSEVKHSPYWYFKYEDDKFKPLFGNKGLKMRRQGLPDVYMPNGAIYITTVKSLYKNNGFYCDKIVPYIMPPERSIDIDEEIDFKLAELLIQEGATNANYGCNK
ncbi:MAG: acylneuraminate cytidylyltransferase family protein [Methanosarcinales archaeon]|nr:acylneuraminate cytidylyltransferase family protein [Methanosarcinales archaeon]